MTKVKVKVRVEIPAGNYFFKRERERSTFKIIQNFATRHHNIICDSKFLGVIYHHFFLMHVDYFPLSILPYKWQREVDTDDHPSKYFGMCNFFVSAVVGDLWLPVEVLPLSSFQVRTALQLLVTIIGFYSSFCEYKKIAQRSIRG